MPRRFLIDGYNVLHAIGLPARIASGHLRHARARLIALCGERFKRDQITIVFDAHQTPPGAPREQMYGGIHVMFAHGDADDLIRELLAHDSAPRSLCLVTSDRALQESARRREAHVIDSVAFLDDLISPAPPPATNQPEKPTSATAADTQRWLDAFQAIDAEPEVRRLQHIDPMNPDPGKTKKHRLRPKKKDDE